MPLNCFASDTMQYAFLCEGAYVTKQNKTRKKKKKMIFRPKCSHCRAKTEVGPVPHRK